MRGLWTWALERFPPGTYAFLVALFTLASQAVAVRLGGGHAAPAAGVVVLLVFLHLRVMDEHKDFAHDREVHPDRALSRGVVTLRQLAWLGRGAIALEAAIALLLGVRALVAWLVVLAFTLSMRHEHGARAFLERHPVVLALVHNPVVVLLALFEHAATGAAWRPAFLWFCAVASLGMLAFEFGRKIRLPEEERPGERTYTAALGQARARALVAAAGTGTGLVLAGLAAALGAGGGVAAGAALAAALPAVAGSTGRQPGKRAELGASVTLVVALGAAAALAIA